MSRTMSLRDEHVITYRVVDARDGVKHNAFYQPMTRQDTGQHDGFLEVTQRVVFEHFSWCPLRKNACKKSKRPFATMLLSFCWE